MRTVDPEIWSKKLKKPSIQTTRRLRFGQQTWGSFETRIRLSFVDAIKDYWANSSIAGIKYINLDSSIRWQRNLQVILFVLVILSGKSLVSLTVYFYYDQQHDVVSPMSSDNHIGKLTFPAVALCSNTVIGKAAFNNYTSYLYSHPKNVLHYQYSKTSIRRRLRNLGAALTMSMIISTSSPLLDIFEEFLQDVEPNYNVSDLMFRFSPTCESLLSHCSWMGREEPCEELFAKRITPLGYCCVFNSRYMSVDEGNKPRILPLTGQDYGLGVLFTENLDDIAYLRRPSSYGGEMLVFQGDEFPLLEGGAVQLQPVPLNASVYYRLHSCLQTTDIAHLSFLTNNCRSGKYHRLLWCLTECRCQEAMALCGCVPFNWQGTRHDHEYPTCSLRKLVCLNKHREKFLYLFPSRRQPDTEEALSEEMDNSLNCNQCYVHCTRQTYTLVPSYTDYEYKFGGSPGNSSLIRLFYSKEQQERYFLEIYTRWYEVFVKICSQWMMFTGISVITVTEFLYHVTIRWVHHFRRRTKIAQFVSRRDT